VLLPTAWFDYLDNMAMPIYVTAKVIKSRRMDKPAIEVEMVGDGSPSIKVTYYIDQHPEAYEGMEDFYLLNPAVKFLSGVPPTM
jgi:hypothetical protein